jgi:hypothetical protein
MLLKVYYDRKGAATGNVQKKKNEKEPA